MQLTPQGLQSVILVAVLIMAVASFTGSAWFAGLSAIIAGALCVFFRTEPWIGRGGVPRPGLSLLIGGALLLSGVVGLVGAVLGLD